MNDNYQTRIENAKTTIEDADYVLLGGGRLMGWGRRSLAEKDLPRVLGHLSKSMD